MPAVGITIHKAQGLSLSSVIVDAGTSICGCGMIYVTLSQVTSLSGLHLIDLNRTKIQCNKKAIQEYNRMLTSVICHKVLEHRERLPSGLGKPSRNFAGLEYLGMDRCSGSLYQPSRARCRMSMSNSNSVSPVPHGGIGYDIGVITCTLCGRQCKGCRGLQAHLRACTKRCPERMSVSAKGSRSVGGGSGTEGVQSSCGGGTDPSSVNGENIPLNDNRCNLSNAESYAGHDCTIVRNSGGDSPGECTQSGPETLGPAWIGNARVTKNFRVRYNAGLHDGRWN